MPEWRLQHTREAYEAYREFYVKNIPTPRASWLGLAIDNLMPWDKPAHIIAFDSAQPCGCDAGANWICERHRNG